MEVQMSREHDWMVFEKSVELTASALRGAVGGAGSQPPPFVAEVFREVFKALKEVADALPDRSGKAGF
ncbi:MAG: hypothetical protein HY240_08050 [Actinobacteria bacterium]|nr:hypothetical protein [Actinomycetota bacterium]